MILVLLLACTAPLPLQGRREPIFRTSDPQPVPRERTSPVVRLPEGRLLDDWGRPLPGWTVGPLVSWDALHEVLTGTDQDMPVRTATDGLGHFRLPEDPGPAFALLARSPDGVIRILREEFRLDGSEIVMSLRAEDRPTAFLEGLLLGPEGELVEGRKVVVQDRSEVWRRTAEWRGDRFRIGPLPPGEHVLAVSAEGFPVFQEVVRVAAHELMDVGARRLVHPGRIRLDLEHPGIELEEREAVVSTIWRDGSLFNGMVLNGPGAEQWFTSVVPRIEFPPRGHSDALAPGRYSIRTRDRRWSAPDVWVDVRAGETTGVQVTIVPAAPTTSVDIFLRLPPGDPSVRGWVRILVANEEVGCEEGRRLSARRLAFGRSELVPGSYRVEARSAAGFCRSCELLVPDSPSSVELTLE